MAENNTNTGGGIGLGSLLLVLFIGLKLTNYIDWSWWWVLSPLWIPFAVIFPILFLVYFVAHLTKS